jgi:hypothetical protein
MIKKSTWLLLPLCLLAAGCGGSGSPSSSNPSPSSAAAGGGSTGGGSPGSGSSGGGSPGSGSGQAESGGALAADAKSAATGDIPDSQNFLTLAGTRTKVSMLYPEGWSVQESPSGVSIKDKNNLVRISLSKGAAPTPASVQSQVAALARSTPGLTAGSPTAVTLKSGPAIKLTYRTKSAPNPVTGKQVELIVDRYVLAHGGRVAAVDLGTPVGVDNVDAYKRMIGSFKWQ